MVEGARHHHQVYASLVEEKRSKVVVEGARLMWKVMFEARCRL